MDETQSETVVLLVEGESITADRHRLCAASPYFAAMFGAGFVEKGKKEVELSCVSAPAVKELLRRSSCQAKGGYTPRGRRRKDEGGGSNASNTDSDEDDTAFNLLQAAGMLQFESAREDCAETLMSRLRPSHALENLSRAELLAERRLAAAAARVALWHFEEASQAKFLPQVPFETMGRLLCDVRLNVRREWLVLEAIKNWWMGGEEGGLSRLPRNLDALLGCVRFSQVTTTTKDCLMEKWKREAVSDLLISRVKRYFDNGLPTPELEKRRAPVMPAVVATKREGGFEIFTLDRDRSVIESIEVVLCEGIVGHNWDALEGFRIVPSNHGSKLFLTGGEFGLGRGVWNMAVICYDVLTDRWSETARLECPRRHHGAAIDAEGTKLALVGGFGRLRDFQASGDVVNLKTGSVKPLPNLPEGVKSPACFYFQDKLYVVKKSVHRLDEDEAGCLQWTDMGVEMDPRHDFILAVPVSACVYLASKHDYKLFRLSLDPKEPGIKEVEGGQFKYETQNLCLVGGVIYNFSSDQFGTTSCVEGFDLATGAFELVWEGETESAPVPFDFSPYYSLGSFPFVQY